MANDKILPPPPRVPPPPPPSTPPSFNPPVSPPAPSLPGSIDPDWNAPNDDAFRWMISRLPQLSTFGEEQFQAISKTGKIVLGVAAILGEAANQVKKLSDWFRGDSKTHKPTPPANHSPTRRNETPSWGLWPVVLTLAAGLRLASRAGGPPGLALGAGLGLFLAPNQGQAAQSPEEATKQKLSEAIFRGID